MDISPDGKWLYKPTNDGEIAFYENLNDPEYMQQHPELESLKSFMPEYKGWVERSSYVRSRPAASRSGSVVSASSHEKGDMVPEYGKDGTIKRYKPNGSDKYTRSIIISNLAYALHEVTLADFKLGTRLWGPLASPDKRERQNATTAGSTSGSKGVLYAGGTTWLPSRQSHVVSDDRFARTLDEESLSSAARCVFPSVNDLVLPSESNISPMDAPALLDSHLYRRTEQDMLNRTRTAIELLPQLSEAIKESGLDFPGTSALVFHGKSAEDDKPEVRLAFVDFAHVHEHDDDLPPDGVRFGIDSTLNILREQEAVLESSVGRLESDPGGGRNWTAWGSDDENAEGGDWNE
ncbi:hypothetical protein IAR50_000535 [Cryptococcus sp. DSM 104548]